MRLRLLLPVLTLAGCGERTEAPPQPPVVAATEPGQWFARKTEGGEWAGFGVPYSEAVFSVRCELGPERITFNTTDMPPSGAGATVMQLSASGVEKTIAAEARVEGLENTDAAVAASEPWLQQLAAAGGNLSVGVGGGEPLLVPIGEAMTSLIRRCRSGTL